jgi:Family of unknown function (DUF6497)
MSQRLILTGLGSAAALSAAGLWLVIAQSPGDTPAAVEGQTLVPVPSGQAVYLQETVNDAPGTEGLVYRFRFVAPAIATTGGISFETAVADMAALCTDYALPRLASSGPKPAQIIISMADKPVPFGEPSPETVQYFEAFSVKNGTCIWSAF